MIKFAFPNVNQSLYPSPDCQIHVRRFLAKIIEKTANNVEEAAQIIRESKLSTAEEEHTDLALNFAAENLALPEVRVEK